MSDAEALHDQTTDDAWTHQKLQVLCYFMNGGKQWLFGSSLE